MDPVEYPFHLIFVAACAFDKDEEDVLEMVSSVENVLPRCIVHVWATADKVEHYASRIKRLEPVPFGMFRGQMKGCYVGRAIEQVWQDKPAEWTGEPNVFFIAPNRCFSSHLLSGLGQTTFQTLSSIFSVDEFLDFVIENADNEILSASPKKKNKRGKRKTRKK